MSVRSPRLPVLVTVIVLLAAACGSSNADGGGSTPGTGGDLFIAPQNSTVLVGVNRFSVAVLTKDKKPILDATASVDVQNDKGTFETRPLQFIGDNYGKIPVYLGTVRFPQKGDYRVVVHATLGDGTRNSGEAVVTVTDKSPELPVGTSVTAVSDLRQRTAADVKGDLSQLDSGVPPDQWHTETIADGVAQHRPMVIYFGEPGRCPSLTCGPTVQVLQKLYAMGYGGKLLFEHVEIHDPAPSEALNRVYVAFGLTSEPWVYFVGADGRVADRFEGPVTIEQLQQAADGTLAGKVPAVDVTIG